MESQQIVSFGWGDFPLTESPPDICTYCPAEEDEGRSHNSLHKRKYLPAVQSINSVISIEPSAKLPAFGWADFPCVEYSNDSFSTIPTSLFSDTLHIFETPDLAELSNSSSDESSDEDEKRPQLNFASKRVHHHSRSSRVVFSNTMEIREYALTVGDHPYTPRFCLTLDWKSTSTVKVALPGGYINYNRRPRRLSERERRERLASQMVDSVQFL